MSSSESKSILTARLNRPDLVATLCGLDAPGSHSYTVTEFNFSLITIERRQSLLSKLDAKSLSLITTGDGLRYQPVQLPECLLEKVNPADFQPIFSVDEEGNPVALPSLFNTTGAVFCWHPSLLWIAVVLQNGTLCIYDIGERCWRPVSLQRDDQENPCDVKFCPSHPSMIAVLSSTNVCLWQLSPGHKTASLQTLQPSNWKSTSREQYRGSMSFSPCGRYLAFACDNQPTVAVWDLSSSTSPQHIALKQRLKSFSSVQFSPNGRYLIALSASSCHYLLWDVMTWECIRWSTGDSPGSVLAWHNQQDLFLIAHLSSSLIHTIRVCPVECSTDFDAFPEEVENRPCFGGNIKDMAWSPDCQRLAMTFTNELDSSSSISSDLIAIIATNVRKDERIKFTPIGFIRGPPSRIPHVSNPPSRLEFRPFCNHGALLAVLWSQGQITFYPLLYSVHSNMDTRSDSDHFSNMLSTVTERPYY